MQSTSSLKTPITSWNKTLFHWCVYIEHPGIYAWLNEHKEHAALSESVRADMIDDTNRKQFREKNGAKMD